VAGSAFILDTVQSGRYPDGLRLYRWHTRHSYSQTR
jgi:hypothetical protein